MKSKLFDVLLPHSVNRWHEYNDFVEGIEQRKMLVLAAEITSGSATDVELVGYLGNSKTLGKVCVNSAGAKIIKDAIKRSRFPLSLNIRYHFQQFRVTSADKGE